MQYLMKLMKKPNLQNSFGSYRTSEAMSLAHISIRPATLSLRRAGALRGFTTSPRWFEEAQVIAPATVTPPPPSPPRRKPVGGFRGG